MVALWLAALPGPVALDPTVVALARTALPLSTATTIVASPATSRRALGGLVTSLTCLPLLLSEEQTGIAGTVAALSEALLDGEQTPHELLNGERTQVHEHLDGDGHLRVPRWHNAQKLFHRTLIIDFISEDLQIIDNLRKS